MSRRPLGNAPKKATISMKTTTQGMAELDRLRGSMTRSAYLRLLLKKASEASREDKP